MSGVFQTYQFSLTDSNEWNKFIYISDYSDNAKIGFFFPEWQCSRSDQFRMAPHLSKEVTQLVGALGIRRISGKHLAFIQLRNQPICRLIIQLVSNLSAVEE